MIAIDETHISVNVDLISWLLIRKMHLNHYEVGIPSYLSMAGTRLEQSLSKFAAH